MGMVTESQFHVLAVDDSLVDRRLIERLLKTSSYQVTAVDSGSKALEFLGLHENEQTDPNIPSVSPNNHPEVEVNLIITDYCMPGMTGYDLLKKVKESSSFRNIPVVIMSSEHEPSRITRCLEEGAEEFFLKPVRASDVRKLKTHMMKTKVKNQKQESHERLDELLDIKNFALQEQKQTPPRFVLQEKQRELLALQGLHQQQAVLLELQEPQHPRLLESQQQLPTQQQPIIQEQMQSISRPNNNKRKSMDEGHGLPSDSTRPRYDGIATMV